MIILKCKPTMKVIILITLIFSLLIVSVGLINLFSMFDVGKCACSPCFQGCKLVEDVPESCTSESKLQEVCGNNSCKYLFGKCATIPKFIDINYLIRGK